jgi:hypothetical protein
MELLSRIPQEYILEMPGHILLMVGLQKKTWLYEPEAVTWQSWGM